MSSNHQRTLKSEDWFCGLVLLVALVLYILGLTVTRDHDVASTLVDNGGFLALCAVTLWGIAKIVRVFILD